MPIRPHLPSQESQKVGFMCALLHFKGVTRRMSFKHTTPPLCYPWYMQVQPGAWSKPIVRETWDTGTPIWSPQECVIKS